MKQNTMPEFVGTTVLDTIGLVIASVDPELRKKMKIKRITAVWESSVPEPVQPVRSRR